MSRAAWCQSGRLTLALCPAAAERLGTAVFCAKVLDANAPSLALFAKLGFQTHKRVEVFGETHFVLRAPAAHAEEEPLRVCEYADGGM